VTLRLSNPLDRIAGLYDDLIGLPAAFDEPLEGWDGVDGTNATQ
jgi:hypothetical protein